MRVLAASDMSVLLAAQCKKVEVCLEWFTQWGRPAREDLIGQMRAATGTLRALRQHT